MATRTFRKRRQPRGVGPGYLTGAKPRGVQPREKSRHREEAAEQALQNVLDLFESESLPGTIARTWIARQEGTSPAVNWSLGNQLLMLLAGTTDARGFQQWKNAGRSVVKGAKCFYILGPVKRTFTDRDDATGEEIKRTVVTGFTAIPVFRIEDTEGASVEPPDYDPPEPAPLSEVAEKWGIPVRYGPKLNQPWLGLYRWRSDGVEDITLASHDDAVFMHELAHAAHRRWLSQNGRDMQNESKERREVVAETVAAVLGRLYGLEVGNVATARAYVAHYTRDGNPGRAAMQALADIQGCLSLILADAESDPIGEAVAA